MALNFLPIALTVASSLLQYKGSQDAARGSRVAGQRQRIAKEAEAGALESKAQQEVAVAQQRSFGETGRAKIIASRVIALSAAGGGGATDPTIINMLADIEGEGAYRAALQVYQGSEEARALRVRASGARYEGALAEEAGEAKSRAYKTSGVAALLQGAGSLYGKYGATTDPKLTGQERYGADYDAYQNSGY